MKWTGYSFCAVCLLALLCACERPDIAGRTATSLDSLSGVVGGMIKELERIDTVTLQKAVNRYNYYNAFIRQNIRDTILKNEADGLQHFYSSGKTLQSVSINNKVILSRARLLGGQISRLSQDLKSGQGNEDQLARYASQEAGEAAKLIDLGQAQDRQFHTALEEFKNALPQVEQLIRSHNRGELPVIIKDTVTL